MLQIAERLEACAGEIQLISICGRNQALEQALRCRARRLKNLVLGYTNEVPRFMQLSDFFIGKPGPGSLSEAVAVNLPIIVERNPRTMPQERYNVEWVVENDLGIVVPDFRGIADAVRQMINPANLARLRANTAAMKNNAVFEIPEILKAIVERSAGTEPERPCTGMNCSEEQRYDLPGKEPASNWA